MKIKTHFISLLSLLLLFCLLFVKPALADTFTLSGTVTDQSNNAIANTTVTVTDTTSGNTVGTVITDSNGAYSLIVPNGTYNVTATPPSSSGFQSVTFSNQVISTDMTLNFSLVPVSQVPPNPILSGQITDPNGNPIPGVTVKLGPSGAQTGTDNNGNYSIAVPPGTSVVALFAPGGAEAGGGLSISQNTTANFQLPLSTVTVHVQDSSGNPVPNAQVILNYNSGANIVSSSVGVGPIQSGATADSNGDATMSVFQTNITFNIKPPNTNTTLQNNSVTQTISQDTALSVTLANKPVNPILSGQITDPNGNSIPGVTVKLGPSGAQTGTDNNGNYSIAVPPGTSVVALFAPGGAEAGGGLSISQDTTANFQLPLSTVTMHIQDSSGNPVANAQVQTNYNTGANIVSSSISVGPIQGGATADSNGDITMSVFQANITFKVSPPNTNTTLLSNSITQTISQNTTIPVTLATRPTNPVLSGQITDSNGNPIPGVGIKLAFSGAQTGTDSNGNYSISVPPGTSAMLIIAPGGAEAGGGLSISQDTTNNIQLPLSTVNLHIQDSSGNPVTNAQVLVNYNSAPHIISSIGLNALQSGDITDANGNVTISVLQANVTFKVTQPNSNFLPFSTTVNITGDTTQVFSLQHPTPTATPTPVQNYTLSGTVYNDNNQNGVQDTGETGYQGAAVILNTGQTTTADTNGNYSFTNLQSGTYTETLTVPNGYTASTTNPATVAVNANTTQNFGIFSRPVVGAVTATPNPVKINTSLSANATFTEGNTADTHTASWNWGDGLTTNGTVTESNGSGSVTNTHTYTTLGSYTITLTVTNNYGVSSTSQKVISVIPTGGLQGGNLAGKNYSGADLSGQNISGGNLSNGTFNNVNFSSANLSGANGSHGSYTSSNFTSANLSGGNFNNANFTGANFTNATLTGTNLSHANFTGANVSGATFTGANKTGIIWSNTICPNGQNSNAHNNSCVGQGGGL